MGPNFISPSSPNGANGWYTVIPSISLGYDVDGPVSGYIEEATGFAGCPFVISAPSFPTLNSFGVGIGLPGDGVFSFSCNVDYARGDQHCFFGCFYDPPTYYTTLTANEFFKVDRVPPFGVAAITGPPNANGWYRTATAVNWTGMDATSGVSACNSGNPWGPSPGTPIGPPDGAFKFIGGGCRDFAGLTSATVPFVYNFDGTRPTTTATAANADTSPYTFATWTNQDVTVTLTGHDNLSGVDKVYYSIDDPTCVPGSVATCQVYSGPFTLTTEGSHTVRYFTLDKAGNFEAAANSQLVEIDKTPPTTLESESGTLGGGGWYTTPVTVTLSASDDVGGSGVAATYYSIDDASCATATPANCQIYGAPFIVTGGGTHTIRYFSKDNAGNYESVQTATFKIDTGPPTTTISLNPSTPDVNGWYVFAVSPLVSATDGGSGVADTRCQLDIAATGDYSDLNPGCSYLIPGSWVMTEGIHTLYAASIDTAGNEESIQTIVFKIDKTPPVSQVGALSMFQGGSTFPVSWSATDALSGVANYDVRYRQASSNGSFGGYTTWFSHTTSTSAPFTAPAGSTTCFSAKATDNAGWTPFAWSPEQCTTVPLDDPALTRTGFWSTVTGSGYYGPGVSRSTSYGNKLSVSLRGQTIGVLVTKQPGGATIELRWNGSTKLTASLSAGSVQKQQLLTFTLPSVQTGTLEIVQPGYGTADIDGAGAYKTS